MSMDFSTFVGMVACLFFLYCLLGANQENRFVPITSPYRMPDAGLMAEQRAMEWALMRDYTTGQIVVGLLIALAFAIGSGAGYVLARDEAAGTICLLPVPHPLVARAYSRRQPQEPRQCLRPIAMILLPLPTSRRMGSIFEPWPHLVLRPSTNDFALNICR